MSGDSFWWGATAGILFAVFVRDLGEYMRHRGLRRKQKAASRVDRFVPGDLVRITLQENDTCKEFNNRHGVVTYGPDDENGWQVSSAPGSLRCVASELTMITPREDRES